MKIAITGHTKGLGAELAKAYQNLGHQVSGFSRSNGYDLRDWTRMQQMLETIQDHDMFISVAKPDFVQTTILYELWKRWKDQTRMIINISSAIAYAPTCPSKMFADPGMDAYRTSKVALNEASSQLSFKSANPQILVVNPVHLYDNPMSEQEQIRVELWVQTLIELIEKTTSRGFAIKEITF